MINRTYYALVIVVDVEVLDDVAKMIRKATGYPLHNFFYESVQSFVVYYGEKLTYRSC